jgi:hypothetical protein
MGFSWHWMASSIFKATNGDTPLQIIPIWFNMFHALQSYSSWSCSPAELHYASDCGAKVIASVDIDKLHSTISACNLTYTQVFFGHCWRIMNRLSTFFGLQVFIFSVKQKGLVLVAFAGFVMCGFYYYGRTMSLNFALKWLLVY